MAEERRLWGRLADNSGWPLSGWAAGCLTVGDMVAWAALVVAEKEGS